MYFPLLHTGRVTLPLKNVVGVEYEHPTELSAYTNETVCQGESPGISYFSCSMNENVCKFTPLCFYVSDHGLCF